MLKVAIVGCGKIADSHAEQILRIPDVQIVAVCDREPLMARQLFDRFPVKAWFSELSEMLSKARPDVVHITTPPQSHLEIGRLCLRHGCHIYVEKPFTLNFQQASELVRFAESSNLKITVGNDAQFTHASLKCRALIDSGYLGGPPVHLESFYCYPLQGAYAKALLSDKEHWVRKLPGGLLHNIISHGLVRVAEFMSSDRPRVLAHGYVSPFLQGLGEEELVDEARVIVNDGQTSAYFTFSSQMRPSLHQLRLYGPKNGLLLDDDEQTVVKLRGARHKSYAEKFLPPLDYARQYLSNFKRNAGLFFRHDFHMKSGMKNLFQAFYRSVCENAPAPIPPRQILLTCWLMDQIFAQVSQVSTSDSPRSVSTRADSHTASSRVETLHSVASNA